MDYARLYEGAEGIPPGNISIQKNICFGGEWLKVHWFAESRHLNMGENWVDGDPGFVSLEAGDYHLRDDAPARRMGMSPIFSLRTIPVARASGVCTSVGARARSWVAS